MGSTPKDRVLLNGVAAIVHALAKFKPVQEMVHTHLTRWRKKNCLIAAQRRKAEIQLSEFWLEKPKAVDPDEYEHWPARTIFSPDRSEWKVVQIPLQLNYKLEKYGKPRRFHYLRLLDTKQDFSLTESFVLLAELHDAAYPKEPLGYAEDFVVDVAEAITLLAKGMSQVAVVSLETLVKRILDRIESRTDSNSRNEVGKSLQHTIECSREQLTDLVIRSRANFVRPLEPEFVQGAVKNSPNRVASPVAKNSLSAGVVPDFAEATAIVPDEYKEQGRDCGPLEGGKTELAIAVTKNRKAKPDDLKKHHLRKVFVREISKRKLEVFFRTFKELQAAKAFLTSANSE